MNLNFYIVDWTGQIKFNGQRFASFNDASDFLTEYIEKTYPEAIEDEKCFNETLGEYQIREEEKNETSHKY